MRSNEVAPDADARVEGPRRPSTVARAVGLGAIVVAGAALLGPAQLSGLRWLPISPPTTSVVTPPPAQQQAPRGTEPPAVHAMKPLTIDLSIALWIALGIAVVLAAVLLTAFIRARAKSRLPAGMPDVEADDVNLPLDDELIAPVVRRGLDNALRILSENREPRDAIVRAWLGLQEAAEDSGIVRDPAETPTEFTRKILGRVSTDHAAITTLLELYLHARFGDYAATSADIDAAKRAVAALSSRWDAASTGAVPAGSGDAE